MPEGHIDGQRLMLSTSPQAAAETSPEANPSSIAVRTASFACPIDLVA